ncbi:MAG: beta-ketoacyl-[acyl-carrier-protein] synthase family protein [Burkholderiales bacterium]|nr:beta-ketoacyl-[acyl-carrier-protein] synthase family protein [Burkholderiales bacterium]
MRRVAVTGIGIVSPLGHTAVDLFDAARNGRSGVHRLDIAGAERLTAPLAATVQFDGSAFFEPARERLLDRVSQFAVVAAARAFADARCELTDHERGHAGVFLGTGMGGTLTVDDGYQTLYGEHSDRTHPMMILKGMHNAPAAWIGIEHGLRGPNLTYSTACSSSSVAIGEAWLRVAYGTLDVAVAGGAEAPLSLGSLKAWGAMHTLASVDTADPASSCKPFAKNRSGLVLGEGAALVVLEPWARATARGATIHGELIGYGLTTDAGHIARPSLDGQAAAMRAALAAACISAQEIDAINAHGTGTQANDSVETAAIKLVFGERAPCIPISATKALHGHLLGAGGALEFVLSLLALKNNVALPTMHLKIPDPECDLDYVPNVARGGAAGRTMLSNSFAFGGTNAVLAVRAVH